MKSVIRFTVMWLAAWCQVLVVAAAPLAQIAMATGPLEGSPICHASDPAHSGQSPSPKHGRHDCALCVMCCQAHGSSAVLLSPSPLLPERQTVAAVGHRTVQPRAPPLRIAVAAQPRGPPAST